MTPDRGTALDSWTSRAGVRRVVVVSPHLDDAAFSLAGTLADSSVPCHVHTILTEADSESDTAWTHATGFATPADEFATRKDEDRAAMDLLGVSFSHGGITHCQAGRDPAVTAGNPVSSCASSAPTLVLLPLGAGRRQGTIERLLRRALRQPLGSMSHDEHVWARVAFANSLRRLPEVTLGYYAEVPYRFAHTSSGLAAMATALLGRPFTRLSIRPDVAAKLAVAECYRSQLPSIMGKTRRYRWMICAAEELLYLPCVD